MDRRVLITGTSATLAVASLSARAQSAGKQPRIAFVTPLGQVNNAGMADVWQGLVNAFLEGMRELGYIDGQSMTFQFYSANGVSDRVSEIAAQVLKNPPDVVIAGGGGANEVAHAFRRLTSTVPIIMANSSDPVEQGLVSSLARPGNNITGFAGNTGPQFESKRLQLLCEVAPHARRVAFLGLKVDWESPAALGVRTAAEQLGVTMLHAEHTSSSYADAFTFMANEKIQGLFSARNPWNFSNRRAVTEYAAAMRIAAVYPTREFPDVGGLMSYGPSLVDLYRRRQDPQRRQSGRVACGAADQIRADIQPQDRHGARPHDLCDLARAR